MEAKMVSSLAIILALFPIMIPFSSKALDINEVKKLAAKNNVTCMLVFGDSSVDPGNNNRFPTKSKGNYPPYGKDFIDGRPTGRFSNGRLATDFIAEAVGVKKAIPGFLDPNLNKSELLSGVSFASASSGYDDLTANLSNVMPVSKQLEYFLHYKIHLRQMVGKMKADEIIEHAIFLISMGSNDFVRNYYVEPIRSDNFTVDQYQNFLISNAFHHIKTMHRLGARKLIVVGVPPFGCMPLIRTLLGEGTECVAKFNKVAFSFNSKMKHMLSILDLDMKTAFIDVYSIIESAVRDPQKYGILETTKGCCGTGTIEFGPTCKDLSTCSNPEAYIFWDAVHPTEKMYKIIEEKGMDAIHPDFFT